MKKTIKQSGLIILLIASATPLLFVCTFQFSLNHVKQDAREELENENRQTITLSASQFNWIENGREISIGGRYFDIATFHQEGNLWTFTGNFDKAEENLVGLMKQHDQPLSGNEPVVLKLAELFQQLYAAPQEQYFPESSVTTVYPSLQHTHLPLTTLSVIAPPPRC
ncbi:MAG: hypothetical protein IPP73_08915 [Chitinophagaceae bacterium]|nr:hypothetical protein [Chitinophagaceae bacterium]